MRTWKVIGLILLALAISLSACQLAGRSKKGSTAKKQPTATARKTSTRPQGAVSTPGTPRPTPTRATSTPIPTRPTNTRVVFTRTPAPTSLPDQTASPRTRTPTVNKAEALLNERCTKCHNLDRVKEARKSQNEWQATVQLMVGKGAVLTPIEVNTLVKYLRETFKK